MATVPPDTSSSDTTASERMRCMEVWGGNSSVERGFDTAGLTGWIHSYPHQGDREGGDVYYVSSCASGRVTRLLLADVTGHGQDVADVASGLRNLMRDNVNLIDQSRFIRAMNQQFSRQPGQGGFATALVCTFFAPTRSLQYCTAGAPSPLLFRSGEQTWKLANDDSKSRPRQGVFDTPLGVLEEADYSRSEVRLEPGDMVLCVSDAFTESRNAHGELLGLRGLLDIARDLDVTAPELLIGQLRSHIARLHPGNLEQDDATVLLFRASGSQPSVLDNLLAPLRLLVGVTDRV